MTLKDRRVRRAWARDHRACRWRAGPRARARACAVADTRAEPPARAQLRAELPQIAAHDRPVVDATLAGAPTIVISPGLAKDQPAIRAAVARGVELVGDVELFARALPPGQKVLAVTGSNGKTTVTALTAALLPRSGLVAVAVGNIGEPVLDALGAYEQGRAGPTCSCSSCRASSSRRRRA